jgi:hypothetical protein
VSKNILLVDSVSNIRSRVASGTSGYVLTTDGTTAFWARKNYVTSVKTSAYTAINFDEIFADTTSSAFSITLPPTPSVGDRVKIADYAGTFSTNNVTLLRNGSNINSAASDYIANISNSWIEFVYVNSTAGWRTLL